MRRIEIDEQDVEDRLSIIVRDAQGLIVEYINAVNALPPTAVSDFALVANVASGQVPMTSNVRRELARVTEDTGNLSKTWLIAWQRRRMLRTLVVADFVEGIEDELRVRFLAGTLSNLDLIQTLRLLHGEQKVTEDFVQSLVAGRTPMEPPVLEGDKALHLHYHDHGPDLNKLTPAQRERARNLTGALLKAVKEDRAIREVKEDRQ